ncbi:MAG: tetratricopeptide repeat protein [Deltaproteobacteria bacterium]|nr:tetratricopeptide repeat protein [Deltaproteobacteria bacterium]
MNKKQISVLILIFLFHLKGIGLANNDFDMAKSTYRIGEYKKSVQLLKKFTKANPANIEAWVLLGDCYNALEKNKQTIEAYKKAISLDPEGVDTILKLGVTFYKMDDFGNAIEAFKLILQIKPDHPEAHFWLGVVNDRIGNIEKAFEEYNLLKSIDLELSKKLYDIIFLE